MDGFYQCHLKMVIVKTLEEIETERLYGSIQIVKTNIGKLFSRLPGSTSQEQ